MSYKIFAFDLDGTLVRSKMPLTKEMSALLDKLLTKYKVAIITGGEFSRFPKQVIPHLSKSSNLENLILEPTSGGQLYTYKTKWEKVYSLDMTEDEKNIIFGALEMIKMEFPFDGEKKYGDLVDDRTTQITFTPVGKDCPIEVKEKWDPDQKKRKVLQKRLKQLLPDFQVRVAGTTSIDITPLYLDKEFGIKKLMEVTDTSHEDIIFFGDKLQEGGNDFPVRATHVRCEEVTGPDNTLEKVEGILRLMR